MAMSTLDEIIGSFSEAVDELRRIRYKLIRLKISKERQKSWQKRKQNQS